MLPGPLATFRRGGGAARRSWAWAIAGTAGEDAPAVTITRQAPPQDALRGAVSLLGFQRAREGSRPR